MGLSFTYKIPFFNIVLPNPPKPFHPAITCQQPVPAMQIRDCALRITPCLFLILAALAPGKLGAATPTTQDSIIGTVTNVATGRTLEGARIVLEDLHRETLSDDR